MPPFRGRRSTAQQVAAAAGSLAREATGRMERDLPWFLDLPAQARASIGLVVHAGVDSFAQWLAEGEEAGLQARTPFAAVPRELAWEISLEQTVALIRIAVAVIEARVPGLAGPGEEQALRDAVLRFSREVAFQAAFVYARAAEERGAWDARLEALLVDAVLWGEPEASLTSRAAALGWDSTVSVCAVVGGVPETSDVPDPERVAAVLRRVAGELGARVLTGVHGPRLVCLVGYTGERDPLAARLAEGFGPGPVVVGPAAGSLAEAGRSVHSALCGLDAVRAWPQAPRPVAADDLLVERLLVGDAEARRILIEEVYEPLVAAGTDLVETLREYNAFAGRLETAARALFVHPNTMRYRLRKVRQVSGLDPSRARDLFTLQTALVVGELGRRL